MSGKKKTVQKQVKPKRAPRPKQLTMNKIRLEARDVNKMEEYIMNDKGEVIKFYPIFPEGKINDMFKELQEDVLYANENDIKGFDDDEFIMNYTMFLTIKHFTSLEKGIKDNLEEKILQMEYLIDSGYYRQIVDEVFMPSEIRKILDMFARVFSASSFIEHINNVSQEKLQDLQIRHEEYLKEIESFDVPKITQ